MTIELLTTLNAFQSAIWSNILVIEDIKFDKDGFALWLKAHGEPILIEYDKEYISVAYGGISYVNPNREMLPTLNSIQFYINSL